MNQRCENRDHYVIVFKDVNCSAYRMCSSHNLRWDGVFNKKKGQKTFNLFSKKLKKPTFDINFTKNKIYIRTYKTKTRIT